MTGTSIQYSHWTMTFWAISTTYRTWTWKLIGPMHMITCHRQQHQLAPPNRKPIMTCSAWNRIPTICSALPSNWFPVRSQTTVVYPATILTCMYFLCAAFIFSKRNKMLIAANVTLLYVLLVTLMTFTNDMQLKLHYFCFAFISCLFWSAPFPHLHSDMNFDQLGTEFLKQPLLSTQIIPELVDEKPIQITPANEVRANPVPIVVTSANRIPCKITQSAPVITTTPRPQVTNTRIIGIKQEDIAPKPKVQFVKKLPTNIIQFNGDASQFVNKTIRNENGVISPIVINKTTGSISGNSIQMFVTMTHLPLEILEILMSFHFVIVVFGMCLFGCM